MRRAIVTGATGAIGTALVRELAEAGVEVLVFVREESARNQNIPVHPLVRRISCSMSGLAGIQNTTGCGWDVFYHLAWAGASGSGRSDMYLQNQNVTYALDAVGAAKRFGCRLFVGAGSQAEYGRAEGKLTPETPVRPEMGYGYAKLCAGQMTRDLAHQLGLRHIWVRILSVYGPCDGVQSMVMSTIAGLKSGRTPKFTKAEQQWDYLYSGDAAKALRMLGEAALANKGEAGAHWNRLPQDSSDAGSGSGGAQDPRQPRQSVPGSDMDGRVYVLGSGRARPLAEYIEEIRDIAAPGSRLGIGEIPYGPGQVMYLCADISALARDTGWQPETSFGDGIRAILASET